MRKNALHLSVQLRAVVNVMYRWCTAEAFAFVFACYHSRGATRSLYLFFCLHAFPAWRGCLMSTARRNKKFDISRGAALL